MRQGINLFWTINLIPRAFSTFQNGCRGEGPGDEVVDYGHMCGLRVILVIRVTILTSGYTCYNNSLFLTKKMTFRAYYKLFQDPAQNTVKRKLDLQKVACTQCYSEKYFW